MRQKLINSGGKWDFPITEDKVQADKILAEIRSNKHVKDLVILRYHENDPKVISNLEYVLGKLKEITHIKRIEIKLGLVVSDIPYIKNLFCDLDNRIETLNINWIREETEAGRVTQNLLEIVNDIVSSRYIPEEIRDAARELQGPGHISNFGHTSLDKASQKYIENLISKTSIPEISAYFFDDSINISRAKPVTGNSHDKEIWDIEKTKSSMAEYKYGEIESFSIKGQVTVTEFASLLEIAEDFGVRKINLDFLAGSLIIAKNEREVETLLDLAEEYKGIKVGNILVQRGSDKEEFNEMDTYDVNEAFSNIYPLPELKEDYLFARKVRRATVNSLNTNDSKIRNCFNQALREAFKEPYSIVFPERNKLICEIRDKIGQDDMEIRKFVDGFNALIVPKLKEHGIAARFDGYKDFKTFFNYCVELISATIYKLFGNGKAWDDLEDKYQTRLVIPNHFHFKENGIEGKFTDMLQKQTEKTSVKSM